MWQILQVVLPVFFIIGAGYLAAKRQYFSAQHAATLMRFATQFAVPCLLFLAIARLDLGAGFKATTLLPFYLGAFSSFTITGLIARWLFRHKPGFSVAVGFSALFSNSVLIGVVIVELAYGVAALEPAFAIVAIHAPFCYLLGITTMEFSRADGVGIVNTIKTVAKQIFSNALTIGLMLGFAVNLTGISLFPPLETSIELIAKAALPTALFGLGAVLAGYRVASGLAEVAVISFNKLLLHPAIAFVLGRYIFELPEDILKPIVVMAAMPPGINAYVFANMYNRGRRIAASSVLLATAVSVVSISVWLAILG